MFNFQPYTLENIVSDIHLSKTNNKENHDQHHQKSIIRKKWSSQEEGRLFNVIFD